MNKEEKVKIRNSNLELLRIVSMILILFSHFYYNNFQFDYLNITINQFIVMFLSSGGKIGVSCFILITGYFMINSKFKIKKLLKLIMQVLFYSIGILIIFSIFSNKNIEIQQIVKSIFPVTYSAYWFMTVYVIIYILSDFINKFLKALDKKEYIILMLILVIIWSIIPTVLIGKIEFSNIDWFILLYMIGAYMKLYPIKKLEKNKDILIILIALIVIGGISVFTLDKMYNTLKIDPLYYTVPMNQIIVLGISICMFLIFKNMKIKNNKLINKIASCTLGVYLIHTNSFARDIIWYNIFDVTKFSNSQYLLLYEICIIGIIYVICTMIDYIRQITVEKLYIKAIDKIEQLYYLKYKNRVNLLKDKESYLEQ